MANKRRGPTAVAGYSRGVAKTIVVKPPPKRRPKPGSGYEARNPSYGQTGKKDWSWPAMWHDRYVSKQTRKPKRSV